MKAAILSDSHDHIPNLRLAIYRCNQEKADLLIHCGDLISPFMLPELARFHGPVHLISDILTPAKQETPPNHI